MDERDKLRVQRLANNFEEFMHELWLVMGWNRQAPLSEVELDIGTFASTAIGISRWVLAFRGIGKTHCIPVTLSLFRLIRDPDRKILVPSQTRENPIQTCGLVRSCLEKSWFLSHMTPRGKCRDDKTMFDVYGCQPSRVPSFKAIGIGGQIEGNRAHSVFPDDLELKKNAKTAEGREKLRSMVTECSNILYPNLPRDQGGPIDPVEVVGVGTIKHEDSLYGHLSRNTAHRVRSWPIKYPTEHEPVLNLSPLLAANLAQGKNRPGDPTCPKRFDAKECQRRRDELRKENKGSLVKAEDEWNKEFMCILKVYDEENKRLRVSDLIVMNVDRDRAPMRVMWNGDDPSLRLNDILTQGVGDEYFLRPASVDQNWAPYSGTMAYIDPTGVNATDEIGVAIGGHLCGTIHAKALVGIRGGPTPENLTSIAMLLREHNCTRVYVESNLGNGLFNMILEPELARHSLRPGEHPSFPDGWTCGVIADPKIDRSRGNKELRILTTLRDVTRQHRLVIDKSIACNERFQRQYVGLTEQKGCLDNDDVVDALEGLVRAWNYVFRIDSEKMAMGDSKEQSNDPRAMRDGFMERVSGGSFSARQQEEGRFGRPMAYRR